MSQPFEQFRGRYQDLLRVEGHQAKYARRPGESHEPIRVEPDLLEIFMSKGASAGISTSVAATLLLELHVADLDLGPLHFERPTEIESCRRRMMSAAEGDYLRSLTVGRSLRQSDHHEALISVPVRLLPMARPEILRAAATVDIDRAIEWEIEALIQGRFIVELALKEAMQRLSQGTS